MHYDHQRHSVPRGAGRVQFLSSRGPELPLTSHLPETGLHILSSYSLGPKATSPDCTFQSLGIFKNKKCPGPTSEIPIPLGGEGWKL